MSDDAKDEMAKRFEIDEPAESESSESTDTMANTTTTQRTDGSSTASNTDTVDDGSAGDTTRDRRQIPMYLPEDQAERIQDKYDELDARSKLAGEGGIEKHKDFFEGFVEAALNNEALEEYVGIPEDE